MTLSRLSFILCTSFVAAALHPALASTIDWVSWTSQPTSTSAVGTIVVGVTPVTVNYSGEIAFTQLNGTGNNYYVPTTTFTAPPDVTNAPPTPDMVGIDGTATVHTINFSVPILDPVFEVVSLGQPGHPTTYTFNLTPDQSISILAQGPSSAYGGCNTCLSVSGNVLSGTEGDGLVQLNGTFSSVSFTGANPEFWNGITVGVAGLADVPAPEPAAWSTVLLGLAGVGTMVRRLRRA